MTDKKVLRIKHIALMLNVSRPTAARLLHEGKIQKIQLSEKCIGAFECDVIDYLLSKRHA